MKKRITLAIAVAALVISVADAQAAGNTWTITAAETRIAASLDTVAKVLQYDRSYMDVPYHNAPTAGKEFLLVNLAVTKLKAGASTFSWSKLKVRDASGAEFARLSDGFLADHGYKRMVGTDLRIGSSSGWVCFEVPVGARTLKLVYESGSERHEIAIN